MYVLVMKKCNRLIEYCSDVNPVANSSNKLNIKSELCNRLKVVSRHLVQQVLTLTS